MRLGFVGVGKHAQKMAAAFRECGAEVVAFDRGNHPEEGTQGWGFWLTWEHMINSEAGAEIDALIICAPPDVTTEVALACAKAGKRCVATKPLMVSEFDGDICYPMPAGPAPARNPLSYYGAVAEHIRQFNALSGSLYVDLWRLYSPAWLAMKQELRGKKIESVHVDFYGNGPVRSFSGLLDYGPHALAFVADLLGSIPEMAWLADDARAMWSAMSPDYGFDIPDRPAVKVETGNGWKESCKRVAVIADGRRYLFEESDIGRQRYSRDSFLCVDAHRDLALRSFCRAFLAGESSDTLRISCEAMRVLMPMVAE